MPHIIVKYFDTPLTQAEKAVLSERITYAITDTLGCASRAVSIALRPIVPADWHDQVFVPDISEHSAELIKAPDYPELTAPTTEREE